MDPRNFSPPATSDDIPQAKLLPNASVEMAEHQAESRQLFVGPKAKKKLAKMEAQQRCTSIDT